MTEVVPKKGAYSGQRPHPTVAPSPLQRTRIADVDLTFVAEPDRDHDGWLWTRVRRSSDGKTLGFLTVHPGRGAVEFGYAMHGWFTAPELRAIAAELDRLEGNDG